MKLSLEMDLDGVTAPTVIRAIRYALESWNEPDFRIGDAGNIIDKDGNMVGKWEVHSGSPDRKSWLRFR